MSINLEDLVPEEASFKLTMKPGKVFTLRRYSLADQIWTKKRFGEKIQEIFDKQMLPEICEMAFNQLKDKSEFKDFMDFASNIVGVKEQLDILKALMATIGFSQPVMDELEKELKSPK